MINTLGLELKRLQKENEYEYNAVRLVWFPDGLKEILAGKSIEEQLLYFWVFENGSINYTPVFYFSKAFRHLSTETESL